MGEFELNLNKVKSLGVDCSESELDYFVMQSREIIFRLLNEIVEVEQLMQKSQCSYFGQAVYNYIIFLEGCIEDMENKIDKLSQEVELIMINSL